MSKLKAHPLKLRNFNPGLGHVGPFQETFDFLANDTKKMNRIPSIYHKCHHIRLRPVPMSSTPKCRQ